MTLTQRLTRAGLVFVLLGSVAAVLPQQGGAAQATTTACAAGTSTRFRVTTDSTGTTDNISANISRSTASLSVTLYSFVDTGSGFANSPTSATFTVPAGSTASLNGNATSVTGNSVIVNPSSSNPANTATATSVTVNFNQGAITGVASYNINVNP